MASGKRRPKRRTARGNRYTTILELELDDQVLLESLIKRYDTVAEDSSKSFVLRQLIRHAAETDLPPIRRSRAKE